MMNRTFSESKECPIINGVIHGTGLVQLFDVSVRWDKPYYYEFLKVTSPSLQELENDPETDWAFCGTIARLIHIEFGLLIESGEGSYGSDGFIAVTNAKNGKLVWIAYFMESNPFIKLEIKGFQLFASSSMDCVWTFELSDPTNFTVSCFN
jgi:hypothetical protein